MKKINAKLRKKKKTSLQIFIFGDYLLKLEDIPLSQIDQDLSELPQMQLPLTKPSCHGKSPF